MITSVDWNQLIADAEAGIESFSDLESNKQASCVSSSTSVDITRSILTFNTNIGTTSSNHASLTRNKSFDDAVDFKRSISKNKSLLSTYFCIVFIEFLESVKHGIPMAIQLL